MPLPLPGPEQIGSGTIIGHGVDVRRVDPAPSSWVPAPAGAPSLSSPSVTAARTTGITGEVSGGVPIIIDDMISTGGTIEAAAHALLAAGCRPPVTVVVTHGLFVGPAGARLRTPPIQQLLVTDSVTTPELALPIQLVSLGPLLSEAITRLHDNRSVTDLVARY